MIGFTLSEEQEALRDLARRFAREEILPAAGELDRTGAFPREIAERAFAAGLMNVVLPEAHGGGGLGSFEEALITEELATACSGITIALVINNLASTPILMAGTEEQRRHFLGRLTETCRFAAYCLTEPEAGSDVLGIRSTAVRKGDEYVINGTKRFITCGGHADWYVVFAATGTGMSHKRLSAFVVPRETPGLTVGKREDMMGQRASNTVELIFEDAVVPVSHRLGAEGDGFLIAMKTFDKSRPGVAAIGVGIARAAIEATVRYATERKSMGKTLAEHQGIQFMLADMGRDLEAARLLVWQAAWLADQRLPNTRQAATAKLFSADAAMRTTTDAVQIFGGYGFSREYPVEKLMRDAKVLQIYEGTSQIQRMIICRQLLKGR